MYFTLVLCSLVSLSYQQTQIPFQLNIQNLCFTLFRNVSVLDMRQLILPNTLYTTITDTCVEDQSVLIASSGIPSVNNMMNIYNS